MFPHFCYQINFFSPQMLLLGWLTLHLFVYFNVPMQLPILVEAVFVFTHRSPQWSY